MANGKEGWEFVSEYVYKAENGNSLFRVKRYRTQTGKTFIQERAEAGGWIGGEGCMRGVRLVPYRLTEWKDERMVCIVEGEKDADNLWSIGIPATCNPGGAGKWRTEFDTLFAGMIVVVLPDNDELGRRHADDIVHHLLPVASLVKQVILPGLPEKGDVSDWIDAGGTRNQLIQLIQQAPAEVSAVSPVQRREPASARARTGSGSSIWTPRRYRPRD